MSSSLTDQSGLVILELSFGQNALYAVGATERPILVASFSMVLRGPRVAGRGYYFRTLQCKISPFDSQYFAESQPAPINCALAEKEELTDQHLQVMVPLDMPRLARLEQMRKVGDLRLRFDCELSFDEVVAVGKIEEYGRQVPVWGLKRHHSTHGQITLTISRSDWVDRILPQTGYGQIHLLELPSVPLERIVGLSKAFDAIKEAQEQQKHGHYNAAIVSCRVAVDSVLTARREVGEGEKKQKIPVLDENWKVRLGESTFNWLNDALGAVKRPGNERLHEQRQFDDFESQMIIALTAVLLAYAARSKPH